MKRVTAAGCILSFHRFAGFKCVLIKFFGELEPEGYIHLFWKKSIELEGYRFFCYVVVDNLSYSS